MKLILALFLAFTFTSVSSQDLQLKIACGKETTSISLDDDNTDKLVTIPPQQPSENGLLTITIVKEVIAKDWKRDFSIYDEDDSAIKDFIIMKDGSYCIKLKELLPSLQNKKEYFIYTTAIPKDLKKAMMVKMARRLVCKIKKAG